MGWGNGGTKPISRNFFVRIVILKDVAHCPQSLKVFVFVDVVAMQRSWIIRVTVAESEIYCNAEVDVATAKDVF